MAVDLKTLIKSRINAIDPTIDTSESSQINMLVVNPLVGSLIGVQDVIDRFDIAFDARRASEMTDDETNQMASRWSVTRKERVFAAGSVVIRYAVPQDVVIDVGQQFIANNGAIFIATERMALTASQMASLFDPINGNYVVTVLGIESVDAGDLYDIGPGEIVSMADQTTNVVSVTNPDAFSKSRSGETNEELIARVVQSASTRNYASNDSCVATVLQDPRVRAASAIGSGEPEMVRDILYGIHRNGMQDIYIYPADDLIEYPVYLATADLANSATYLVQGGLAGQATGPYVFIKSVEYGSGSGAAFVSAGALAPGEDYLLDFYQSSEGDKNSAIESWVMNFVKIPGVQTIKVVFLRAPLIAALQSELPALGARATAHRTLYKAITPIFLDIDATVKPAQGKSSDPAYYVSVIQNVIKSAPIASRIDESDLIAALSNAGADRVDIPVLAHARVLYPDLSYATVDFDQEIDASTISRGSATERTMAFYPGTVNVSIAS